jgi:hypothetical protein
MKKFLAIVAIACVAFTAPNRVQAQVQTNDDYAGYLGALDTLTNTDTTEYIVSIKGAKHIISFQVNVLKLTGTVAGKFDIQGSVDGVNYETALAASSVTKTDASANYVVTFTNNKYQKYRIRSISSGTNTHSQRVYMLYRKQP